MSTTSQEQEIDLSQIGKSISKVFQNVVNTCFDLLFFIQKKIIIIAVLFILGVVLGFLSDKKPHYNHKIVVIPNFGSNDYLYEKVDLISSKLKERDAAFFKTIGISDIQNFSSIEVKPISGIYNFINSESQKSNFEFIKLMAEDGELDKIIKDDLTSRNYYLHAINISSSTAFDRKDLVEPLLKYLQQTEYFTKLQKVYQSNLFEKIEANKLLITQIDQIIFNLTQNKISGGVTISENSGLSELIQKKDALIHENQQLSIHKLEYDKVIKDQNISLNQINTKGTNNKMKIILPFLFVSLFLLGYWFSQLYKQQKKRIQS
jgi:ribosomal protein S17E